MGYRKKKSGQTFFEKGRFRCHLEFQTLFLEGVLEIDEAAFFVNDVLKDISFSGTDAVFDLDGLMNIDSAGAMSLYYAKSRLAESGIQTSFAGGNEAIHQKLELFSPEHLHVAELPARTGFVENLGNSVATFFSSYVFEFIILAANIFYWSVVDFFRRKVRREGEFVNQAVQIGVNAVLIVVFLSFVIGFVLALQSASSLRTFGANIFVVDLVVIAVMSQMGPLITAVLVAGRSGSAIAAEIATMKVTSELDALKTMGLDPIRFVVVPKLYACLFTMPFLVIIANAAGVVGGALAANIYLDITPEIFINRTAEVMTNKHLITSFVKSQVYASLIVLTGSFYGFRVVRGAEGVGKVTTNSVVVSIALVILADSILGLLFF